MLSRQIFSRTTVFIIEHKKCFVEHETSILELFLMDHVTLKTGVMMLKNRRNILETVLPSQLKTIPQTVTTHSIP